MKQALTKLHNNRFDWAIQAKNEFTDRFIRFDVQMLKQTYHTKASSTGADLKLFPFLGLQNCTKLIEKERKHESEKYENEMKFLEVMISEKKALLDKELNFFHMENRKFSSKIETYNRLLNDIKTIVLELESTDVEMVVKGFFKYDVRRKKASILNHNSIQLQLKVEKMMESQLMEIKKRASDLGLNQLNQLKAPQVDDIPKIQQKIDLYWLNSRYDKAFHRLYNKTVKWTDQMYQGYQDIFTFIMKAAGERHKQLCKEADALIKMIEEKIGKLQEELSETEEKRTYLLAEQVEVNEMWQQDHEHALQLQGYFIKHWLLYKQELQRQLLAKNLKESWIVSQYLQLLQQDGEQIIESINI